VTGIIRLLIADDHPVVRDGLRGIFEASGEFEVAGEAANGREAVDRAAALRPDVVLMDLRMPVLDGVSAIRLLAERGVTARVLVLTTFDTDTDVVPAIEAGATGYLLKDSPPDELLRGVRAAARGEAVLSPSVATRLIGQVREPAKEPLSQRELDVLGLIAQGCSNREAAVRLFISEATVKTHVLHIYAKLGVNDRAAAVATGFGRGLLPRPGRPADRPDGKAGWPEWLYRGKHPGPVRDNGSFLVYRQSRKSSSSRTWARVSGSGWAAPGGPATIRCGPGPASSGPIVRHSSSTRPASTSRASRCGPPSASIRRWPRSASAATAVFRSTVSSPATMTSAFGSSAARISRGAWAVVMTMVRASGGAPAMSGLAGSRSSRAVITAIGGVGARPDRRPVQSCCGRAGL
jgi:DNA-binding NarL/FixJ family response regulator